MIIDDLNYLEVISEDTSCVEGSGAPQYRFLPSAEAISLGDAVAIGYRTQTATQNYTETVSGLFSHSSGASLSSSVG